jgi:hypothetical protein
MHYAAARRRKWFALRLWDAELAHVTEPGSEHGKRRV